MGLTKLVIDKAKYAATGGRADIRWDEGLPGFGLRVYPSGRKSFVLSYRTLGRKHLMVLGPYGVLTLDEARTLARIKIGEISQGKDPLASKKNLVKRGTVGELCEAYLEQHSKIHKKSWKEDQRRLTNLVLPVLGGVPVAGVTATDIAQLHLKVGRTSIYEANRTVELLRGIFEKGKLWGFLEPHAINPAKGVQRYKEKKRDRWLTPEELPRVARAISEEGNIYIKGAIWLYLLTGIRKTELLTAKWSDVSLERNELRLRDTKSGNDHFVPLSSAAVALLGTLPRQADNPYLIPGLKPGSHLVNISKPWNRIRQKAGVADVRIHDLRRTVGSWLAQNGTSLHLISRVLNHRSTETTKIYARFGEDSMRTALEGHGRHLLAHAPGPIASVEATKIASDPS